MMEPGGCPLEDDDRLDEALSDTFPASDPIASWAGPPAPAGTGPPTTTGGAADQVDDEAQDPEQERRLAEALVESFPCSDPPATWAGPSRG